jgi:hypothetical protein
MEKTTAIIAFSGQIVCQLSDSPSPKKFYSILAFFALFSFNRAPLTRFLSAPALRSKFFSRQTLAAVPRIYSGGFPA